ncbi:MAG: hypothetical protein V4813_11660 [Gemmatimonadota bacterium]
MLRFRTLTTGLACCAAATLTACADGATAPDAAAPSLAVASTGNGAPSGAHYNLNVIGVSKGKSAEFDGGNGHRLFVGLGRTGASVVTNIKLAEGPFAVLDANGTDGEATFQLPNPVDDANGDGVDDDGKLGYSVYVRALGNPKGSASMTSCYTDTTGTWCNAGDLVVSLNRVSGNKFVDVSKQLLQVCVDADGDLTYDLEPIFADAEKDYFWEYTNSGLRLAQMRFYPVASTDIGGTCGTAPTTR